MSIFGKPDTRFTAPTVTFTAHRGYSSIAPENTIPAFREAVKAGFGAMECDVWPLKGDTPVFAVMHDESLRRMCGADVNLTDLTPAELRRYPVKKGAGIKKYGGQLPVPLYEEFLQTAAQGGVIPVIEIKSREPANEANALSDREAAALTGKLYEILPQGDAVIQSFNFASLMAVRPYIKKETRLFLLTKEKRDLESSVLIKLRQQGIAGISMKDTLARPAAIKKVKSLGLQTAVWTVNSQKRAYRLAAVDRIDFLISDQVVVRL